MVLRNRQGARSRTTWPTTVFWILTFLFVYALLGLFGWWLWLAYLGAGSALTCLWWTQRRHSRYAIVFGSTCTASAVVALAMIGWALCATVSIPVDSVGPRTVVCGSVLSPVPADELTVTIGGVDEPGAQSRSIPQDGLERRCSNRLDDRSSRAAGLTLIALFVAVRAAGHFVSPRKLPTA